MGAVISAQRDTMSMLAQRLREEVDARGNNGLDHVRSLLTSIAGTPMLGEVADEHVVSLVNAFESNLLAIRKKAFPPKTDFQAVREFNIAAGNTADTFNASQVAFYTGMQLEELAEKLAAIAGGVDNLEADQVFHRGLLIQHAEAMQRLGGLFKSRATSITGLIAKANPVDLLDADLDVVVVSHGSVLSQGVNGDAAMGEVHRANLSKVVDGKLLKDPSTGKILKPEGWMPPNLDCFVSNGRPATEADTEVTR